MWGKCLNKSLNLSMSDSSDVVYPLIFHPSPTCASSLHIYLLTFVSQKTPQSFVLRSFRKSRSVAQALGCTGSRWDRLDWQTHFSPFHKPSETQCNPVQSRNPWSWKAGVLHPSHKLNNRWQTWAIVIIIHWFINPIWTGSFGERKGLLVIDTDEVWLVVLL